MLIDLLLILMRFEKLLEYIKKFDIITNNLNRNCPKGLTCELAQSKIFFDLDEKNLSKVEKEHIFDYFYENKQGYKIFSIKNNLYKKNRNKNFSIDNLSDLKRVRKIYKLLNNIYFPTKKILLFRDE